ncbi:hypothetical protein ACIBHY_40370 [Nonomuraea sp. NPDC050547]|uniref:hypothetical protein n=1 Tax=Nonomuraea sp. NPDC050547 TaxID=3364368 RepID=UPI0037BBC540
MSSERGPVDVSQGGYFVQAANIHGDTIHLHSRQQVVSPESQIVEMQRIIAMRTPDSDVAPNPVVIYLENPADFEEVRTALGAVLDAFGQKIILASNVVIGSIWQAFISAVKRQGEPGNLNTTADALTAGATARWYGEPQSQITKAQGEAIAALLETLKGTDNALLTFSNILIVKVDGVPLVRELTPEQVARMQRNPSYFADPRLVLSKLEIEPALQAAGFEEAQRHLAP